MLGTVVGDSIGLPMEGLSPRRVARRFGGPLRQRLCFGYGMVSDDTDHLLFVGQALLARPHDVEAFRRALGWKLRFWFVSLPAGVGLATLRACLRLWLGLRRSGVYSAGNGPAMRAPLLGAALADDPVRLAAYVRASTELTHTDPRALVGALVVARLAAWAALAARPAPPDAAELEALLLPEAADAEWRGLVAALLAAWDMREAPAAFAARLGLAKGVTGYMYHTVPVAVYVWLFHFGDFAATLSTVIALGGDTDSVAAVAGALAGAVTGESGIPAAWHARVLDWPRGPRVWRGVAAGLAHAGSPVAYAWPALVLRNMALLAVVLVHAVGRLWPF